MTLPIFLQLVIVLAAIWMGARYSGVGLGLFGASVLLRSQAATTRDLMPLGSVAVFTGLVLAKTMF